MRFHRIALKDLRIRLRDRNTLILMLLLPVALTAIIGFAFGGDSGISEVEFVLVPPEGDDFLTDAVAGMISRMEILEAETATEEEARELVAAGDKSAAIVVPDGLLEAVFEGEPAEVRVLTDPASSIKAGIVREMAERAAARANAGSVMGRGIFDALETERELTEGEQWRLGGFLLQWMYEAWGDPPVAIEEEETEGPDIDVHAYFAPSFAVLFLLFTMLASAKTIHEERESGTYDRLMTAPLSRASFIGGKLLGAYLLASVQILLLLILSSLLFGVRWGSHPAATAAMALATAAGASSLAVLIASLARTSRQTDNVGTAFVLIMSLVGGSMWPIEQAPETLQRVARFTFNYWALNGFKDLVFRDAGFAGIAQELLVILIMSAVCFVLAARFLARR